MKRPLQRWMPAAVGLALLFGFSDPAVAQVTLTMTQTPTGVVMSGGGSLSLSALTFFATQPGPAPQIIPDGPAVVVGPSQSIDVYNASLPLVTGPTNFGPGALAAQPATSATGNEFGFNYVPGNRFRVGVPAGYTSGTTLSGTDVWSGATYASLGVTPGTYVWSWSTSAPGPSSITLTIAPLAVPEPSPAIGAALCAVAFLAFGWSRDRRERGRQAAA
jgi:hypothetical protein